jgi:NDP-mannose synthase
MKAVILAGGEGQRLLPYTASFPKPMMPVGNKPILELITKQLKAGGIEEILIATGYMEEVIRSYFGDGALFGIPIRYSREEKPLGTAGPLSLVRQHLREPFVVINGDILTDIDLKAFIGRHRASSHDVTLGLVSRQQQIDFGVVRLDAQGMFEAWDEKPALDYLVSMGIYVMNPNVLALIPGNTFLNLPDFVVSVSRAGLPIGSYVHQGYWLDIGRREDYERACRDAESLCQW